MNKKKKKKGVTHVSDFDKMKEKRSGNNYW